MHASLRHIWNLLMYKSEIIQLLTTNFIVQKSDSLWTMLEHNSEVIATCAGAVASLMLFKYLLVRSEKPSTTDASCEFGISTADIIQSQPSRDGYCTGDGDNYKSAESPERDRRPTAEVSNQSTRSPLLSGRIRVIGLQNLGNTCYLNAILQALACLPSFYNWIEQTGQFVCIPKTFRNALPTPSSSGETPFFDNFPGTSQEIRVRSFFHLVRRAMNVLNCRHPVEGDVYIASDIVRIMNTGMGKRAQYCQQDPDELFLFMVNCFISAADIPVSPTFQLLQSNNKIEIVTNSAFPHFEHGAVIPPAFIPFQGLFHQDLYCVICKSYRAQPLEVFYSLSLSLSGRKPHGQVYSLENLLHSFFTPADLDSVECPTCTLKSNGLASGSHSQAVRTPHLKRISIAKAPKIVCIHIRRAVWGADDAWKRSDYVSFPSSLTLGQFSWMKHLGGGRIQTTLSTSDLQENRLPSAIFRGLYSLDSVVVHVGQSSHGGHIVTYRKGPVATSESDNWFFTSDHVVRPAPWSEVVSSNPYMLFYERNDYVQVDL